MSDYAIRGMDHTDFDVEGFSKFMSRFARRDEDAAAQARVEKLRKSNGLLSRVFNAKVQDFALGAVIGGAVSWPVRAAIIGGIVPMGDVSAIGIPVALIGAAAAGGAAGTISGAVRFAIERRREHIIYNQQLAQGEGAIAPDSLFHPATRERFYNKLIAGSALGTIGGGCAYAFMQMFGEQIAHFVADKAALVRDYYNDTFATAAAPLPKPLMALSMPPAEKAIPVSAKMDRFSVPVRPATVLAEALPAKPPVEIPAVQQVVSTVKADIVSKAVAAVPVAEQAATPVLAAEKPFVPSTIVFNQHSPKFGQDSLTAQLAKWSQMPQAKASISLLSGDIIGGDLSPLYPKAAPSSQTILEQLGGLRPSLDTVGSITPMPAPGLTSVFTPEVAQVATPVHIPTATEKLGKAMEGVNLSSRAKHLLADALQGDAQAQKDWAVKLFNGQGGLTKNTELAMDLYRSAADLGNKQAMVDLAYFKFHGQGGLPIDRKAAIGELKELAKDNKAARAMLDDWLGIKHKRSVAGAGRAVADHGKETVGKVFDKARAGMTGCKTLLTEKGEVFKGTCKLTKEAFQAVKASGAQTISFPRFIKH